MDVLINIAIFIILLFLYLHVQNQLRRNEDLEISEIDYSDNENLQDVCELKQPLLFDYKIANKERNAISEWVEKNPNWFDTEEKQMEYLTLINKICEPIENDLKNGKKIIKIVSKEIILNKDIEKLLNLNN